MLLKEKKALVTGSSRGIGKEIVKHFLEEGAQVWGLCTKPSSSKAELEELARANGSSFYEIYADCADASALSVVIKSALEQSGGFDVLVNNAGIIRREDAIRFSEQDWDDVVNTNLKTLFFLSQEAAKHFIAQKSGRIINIASMLSFQGGIRVPSYTAAKSGVKGLTMALANEWAKDGVTVNAIAPGYMETNNTAALRGDTNRNAAILERIPAGRWGTPADLKGAAVFLASPAAAYVNGCTLAVDGGWLAR